MEIRRIRFHNSAGFLPSICAAATCRFPANQLRCVHRPRLGLAYTASKAMSLSESPSQTACCTLSGVNGESSRPCMRPSTFHSFCPCRAAAQQPSVSLRPVFPVPDSLHQSYPNAGKEKSGENGERKNLPQGTQVRKNRKLHINDLSWHPKIKLVCQAF